MSKVDKFPSIVNRKVEINQGRVHIYTESIYHFDSFEIKPSVTVVDINLSLCGMNRVVLTKRLLCYYKMFTIDNNSTIYQKITNEISKFHTYSPLLKVLKTK